MKQHNQLVAVVERALTVALSVLLNFIKLDGPRVATGGAITVKAFPLVIVAR